MPERILQYVENNKYDQIYHVLTITFNYLTQMTSHTCVSVYACAFVYGIFLLIYFFKVHEWYVSAVSSMRFTLSGASPFSTV